jgi:hypothetical protein
VGLTFLEECFYRIIENKWTLKKYMLNHRFELYHPNYCFFLLCGNSKEMTQEYLDTIKLVEVIFLEIMNIDRRSLWLELLI